MPRMAARMLLKSCAMPPASVPIDPHRLAEARSLAAHRVIAARLREHLRPRCAVEGAGGGRSDGGWAGAGGEGEQGERRDGKAADELRHRDQQLVAKGSGFGGGVVIAVHAGSIALSIIRPRKKPRAAHRTSRCE